MVAISSMYHCWLINIISEYLIALLNVVLCLYVQYKVTLFQIHCLLYLQPLFDRSHPPAILKEITTLGILTFSIHCLCSKI